MFMLFSLHLNFAIYQAFDGQTERSQATNYVTLSYSQNSWNLMCK